MRMNDVLHGTVKLRSISIEVKSIYHRHNNKSFVTRFKPVISNFFEHKKGFSLSAKMKLLALHIAIFEMNLTGKLSFSAF